MEYPTLQELDKIRKKGFRPQVVGCFLLDKKILFVHDSEYNLWQLPQGGVNNGENVLNAIEREMEEELGSDFAGSIKVGELIAEDQIEFPIHKQGMRELKSDDGDFVHMRGKHYFFFVILPTDKFIDINQAEFDECKWLDYERAIEFTETIYQRGKKRITLSIIQNLKQKGLL
ncbi:NUDIX hydrolase [Patescibacteria group bacterium]|nr:NUDIX hydrolase [Patescibacteria group bacterium]